MDGKVTRRTGGRYTKGRVAAVPRSVRAYVAKALDRVQEDKQLEFLLATEFPSVSNTWSELYITQMVQGPATYQRLGSRCRIKSVLINGIIAGGQAAGAIDDPWNVFRVVLGFYNNTVAGTGPLGVAPVGMGSSIDKLNVAKLDWKLVDEYVALPCNTVERDGGDGYTPQLRKFKYFKRFPKGALVNWQDQTATNAGRALWMSCLSDSVVAPSPGFVTGHVKITYEDA